MDTIKLPLGLHRYTRGKIICKLNGGGRSMVFKGKNCYFVKLNLNCTLSEADKLIRQYCRG